MRFRVGAAELAGQPAVRLDRFVALRTGTSRAGARRLVEEGAVLVGGRQAGKGTLVREGDEVELLRPLPSAEELRPVPERDLVLDVLYEDGDLVVVAKPAGVATHPLKAGETGTLANALVARYPECALASEDPREGGVAHRLDRGTTGVLVAARNRALWEALREEFRRGRVEKRYLALASGTLPDRASVGVPLAHAPHRPGRVIAVPDPRRAAELGARAAHTDLEVVERFSGLALVEAVTRTGRMHQVRVHLASLGAPICNDQLYGGTPYEGLRGFFLHAASVSFQHPRSGRRLHLDCALPPDRAAMLAALRRGSG